MEPRRTSHVNTPEDMVTPIQPITEDLPIPEPIPDRPVRHLVAVFSDEKEAVAAIRELKDSERYEASAIGIAMRDRTAEGRLVQETGTHTLSATGLGILGGGVLGGLAGWLVGVGALGIPGVGPVVAGGALATALGVAGSTAAVGAGVGATAGGLAGALVGLGIPEEDARWYEQGFREGAVVVTVRTQDTAHAVEVLRRHGGALRMDDAPSGDVP